MRFKNLSIYQLAPGNPLSGLDDTAAKGVLFERMLLAKFQPCPASQPESAGFVPPFGE